MLRGLREARWAGLAPEATAEEVWSEFRDAVIAACDEGIAYGATPGGLGLDADDGEEPPSQDPPPAA